MDSGCVQGDALAADPSWLELLLSLLASDKLPAAVGETVSALLGANKCLPVSPPDFNIMKMIILPRQARDKHT